MLEDIFTVFLVPETEVFEGDLSSWEDLSAKVYLVKIFFFDEVCLEILYESSFRLEFGEFVTLSQGLKSWSEGVETHIESDYTIFQTEIVKDKEDSIWMEVRVDD